MRVEQATAPIIIFGAPRSGTTYLNSILNEHPDVSITEESRLFVWMHQSLTVLSRRDESLYAYREQFIEHLRCHLPEIIRFTGSLILRRAVGVTKIPTMRQNKISDALIR